MRCACIILWGKKMNGKNVDVNYDLISADIIKRAEKIALILMDVDGVMTDGTLFYLPGPNGEAIEFKGFNSHDGLGLHFCHAAGIKTGVISGRDSFATTERARMLKMTYVYQGHLKKIPSFEEILQDAQLPNEAVAFIGDDFTDVPLFNRVGLACAVANARPEVKEHAHYITAQSGGHGAVREVVEIVLKARGFWPPILKQYELIESAKISGS